MSANGQISIAMLLKLGMGQPMQYPLDFPAGCFPRLPERSARAPERRGKGGTSAGDQDPLAFWGLRSGKKLGYNLQPSNMQNGDLISNKPVSFQAQHRDQCINNTDVSRDTVGTC